jgi:subtilisin-like proprotein convertase family protein
LLEDRRLLRADSGSSGDNGLYVIRPEWFAQIAPAAELTDQSAAATATSLATAEKNTQWIVQFDNAALQGLRSVEDTQALFGKHDLKLVGGLGRLGQVVVATAESDSQTVSKWLSANPNIAYFEPNLRIWSIDVTPNDSRLSELWGMNNTGQTGGGDDSDIDAFEAWDVTTGSGSVVVGVIDTGVDYNHPDLAANIWTNPGEIAGNNLDDDGNGFVDDVHGYDFANNDGDPMDDQAHGTHVSGTIAAVGNNQIGVSGVNWSSSIMALKFLDAGGSGSTANAVRAVNYATMMRQQYGINVRVTNNSWGGGGFNQALEEAIEAGAGQGILFVAAAGNDGEDNDLAPHFPANFDVPSIISVAATDHLDALARFSNFGAQSVDVAAPGESILSTLPNNSYGVFSGTSMATPHVSGVAALAWSLAPDATLNQVRDAITGGADPVESLDGRLATGGRLNARETLNRLGMNVSAAIPAPGSIVASPPTVFQISFNYSVDPQSLDPLDLTVNQVPADSVAVIGANIAAFTFNSSPVTVEGPQSMRIAEGSISRQGSAETVRGWQAAFYYDTLPLAITASAPAEGAIVPAPPTEITLDFNEPIDPASVGVTDLAIDSGIVSSAAAISATSVRYVVQGLPVDGHVEYRLRAGALTDVHGNPTADLVRTFTIDDPLIHRFESDDVPRSIPDRGTTIATLQIPSGLSIADLDVGLDITHTFDGDLDVYLQAPDGTRVELFTDVGGGGANFVGTVLDDEANQAIQTSGAPFTGHFRPEGQLAAFNGKEAMGTWSLQVTDDAGTDVGTLTGWELILREDADVPPRIVAIPELPVDHGTTWSPVEMLTVHFSKAMQPDSINAGNWQLLEAGPDQQFNTADDIPFSIAVSPPYSGGLTAALSIGGGALLPGKYRFQANSSQLFDLSGNPLDGNGDRTGGDLYVRHFSVVALQADPLEPNDTLAQANDLGLLGSRTEANLSLHAAGNDDYYRFTTAMAGILAADVFFSHAAGDVNAELLDNSGNVLSTSASTSDNERLFWTVGAGESYYLRVLGHASAVNPSYTLQLVVSQAPPGDRFEPNDSFAAAFNFGSLSNRSEAGLSVHFPDNDDYYRFTPATSGAFTADVLFSHSAGDLDAVLYDASQTRLTYSDSRNNDERLVWNVTAGQTYYLLVHGYEGAINPNYAIQLLVSQSSVADRFEANDTFTTATDLGPIGNRNEPSLSIHAPGNEDYYRFTAATSGVLIADVLFRHAAGDLDAVLYSANRNWLRSSTSANDDEQISWGVTAGQTYYLRVYGYEGATNSDYTLRLAVSQAPGGDRFEPNDSFAAAADLGALGSRIENDLSLHISGNDDFYRFTPQITGLVTILVSFNHSVGDIDIKLFDANHASLASSASTDDRERMTARVTAGQTYYLQVYGYSGETNPNYSLNIAVSPAPDGDSFEPNNSFAQATDLGALGNRNLENLSIHLPDDDDYYRFTTVTAGKLSIDVLFAHAGGDIDIALYNSSQNEVTSSASWDDDEHVEFDVTAGQTYYLLVYGFNGETNADYTLVANLGVQGTEGNDLRYLAASADGARLEVFNSNPPTAGDTPVFTWPMDSTTPLNLNLLGGDDTVVLALPAGMAGPAGGLRVDTGSGTNNRLLVLGGDVRIDAVSTGGALDTTVSGNAHVTTGRLKQNQVTLGDSATLSLLPDGGASLITALTIAPGATLDIGNDALVVDYSGASPATAIRERIVSGRGATGLGASWTGKGITSSAVAAANLLDPESRSIAFAENAALPLGAYTTFRGQPVDNTAVLIAFTRTADANLDGLVNDDDVTILGASYAPAASNTLWALGDFDYNGLVDDDDVTLLGAFYNPSTTPLAANALVRGERDNTKLDTEDAVFENAAQSFADDELITLIASSIVAEGEAANASRDRPFAGMGRFGK